MTHLMTLSSKTNKFDEWTITNFIILKIINRLHKTVTTAEVISFNLLDKGNFN
jgi:hypothetical protein